MALTRRGFLGGILAACAAPAIIKAEILMPVRSIIVPPILGFQDITCTIEEYSQLYAITDHSTDALRYTMEAHKRNIERMCGVLDRHVVAPILGGYWADLMAYKPRIESH